MSPHSLKQPIHRRQHMVLFCGCSTVPSKLLCLRNGIICTRRYYTVVQYTPHGHTTINKEPQRSACCMRANVGADSHFRFYNMELNQICSLFRFSVFNNKWMMCCNVGINEQEGVSCVRSTNESWWVTSSCMNCLICAISEEWLAATVKPGREPTSKLRVASQCLHSLSQLW